MSQPAYAFAETPPPSAEMNALLVRVRDNKDKAAFTQLFDYFAPRLKSYLLRQGAKDHEAEEFVQETMLAVWRHAGRFDPSKASASTWIFTIARNRRIDSLRRKKAITTDLDAALDVQSEDNVDQVARAMTLETQQARLQEAMKSLPQEQKDLLMRSFFDNKSHGDIAAETGLPLGTVKSRIRLAMDRLRKAFGGQEQGL